MQKIVSIVRFVKRLQFYACGSSIEYEVDPF